MRGSNISGTSLIACQNPLFMDLFGACKSRELNCRYHLQFAFQRPVLVRSGPLLQGKDGYTSKPPLITSEVFFSG